MLWTVHDSPATSTFGAFAIRFPPMFHSSAQGVDGLDKSPPRRRDVELDHNLAIGAERRAVREIHDGSPVGVLARKLDFNPRRDAARQLRTCGDEDGKRIVERRVSRAERSRAIGREKG